MVTKNIITKNILGFLIGAAVVYFFKQIISVSIFIWGIPQNILGAIGLILTLLLGGLVGAVIQSIASKN